MRVLFQPLRLAAAALCISGWRAACAAEPLTLAEARRSAAARGWELLAARGDVAQAEAARLAARAVPNPVLSLSLSKVPTDGTPAATTRGNGLLDRSYDTVASLGELVEVGKRGPRKASAEAALASSRLRLEDVRRRLDAAVVKAYAAAAAAEETARVNRASAESLAASARIARDRFEAGDVSRSEAMQVSIAAGRFESDARTAETAALEARLALESAAGEPEPTGSAVLADPLSALADRAARLAPAGATGAGAIEARPDLRAAAAAVTRAEQELRLQKALRLPDPTLSFQVERQPPDQANSAGVGLSIPLPVFSRNAGGIRAAEAALESARRDLSQARARAHAEIAAARAALEAARARHELLGGRLVPDAESVRDSVSFSYGKGGASLLELLEAERNLNDVRLAAAAAAADLVASAADYATALGEPIP